MGAANSYWRGELAITLEHCGQVLSLYDRRQHKAIASLSSSDSEVYAQGYASLALWNLGYPNQALTRVQGALALARELSHPNSLAFALAFAVRLSHYHREVQIVQEQAEALIALATTHGLPYFLTAGTIDLGWALIEQGLAEEGMVRLRQGLATIRAIAPGQVEASWLVIQAGACETIGQREEGLAVIARALALVDKGVRVVEAELYRLKGELTLQSSVPSPESRVKEAEVYFLKATDIARTQQAKSLELRAATSLARLWQRQGKRVEAHKLLFKVYNWFTEGFDTKDLQEAKALLEELSA
jgi:adenylate cyclase